MPHLFFHGDPWPVGLGDSQGPAPAHACIIWHILSNSAPERLELCVIAEISELLGLSAPAVKYRAGNHQDFPQPLAQLRSSPIYSSAEIVAYARERACSTNSRA